MNQVLNISRNFYIHTRKIDKLDLERGFVISSCINAKLTHIKYYSRIFLPSKFNVFFNGFC